MSNLEVDVDSPSIISLRSLATFLLAFGIAATIVINTGGSFVSQLSWGFISALCVTFIYFLIMKFMYSMQGSSMSSAENLIGKTAIVTIPTTDSGKAQIRIVTETGSTEYSCIENSGKKLKQNQSVTIINIIDAGTLIVESK
jgi:membrane protein implicated in regulation of membrane protease activity